MSMWAYYIWAFLLIFGCGIGWLTTLVTLPGNWIITGLAALFAWLIPVAAGGGITWTVVAVLVGLAVLGEILEFGAGAAGAAKQGASKRSVALAMLGAAIGSMVGLGIGLPIPILGSLVMAVLGGAGGAFAGAYLGESWKGRPVEDRMAAGRGAFAGRIWGTVGKLVVGMIMLVIVAWEALL
ncbi:MAG TPA: DUF456 family protein [Lacipirellulaceae bacterium]|jgi:hypothetical protein|nr:DUF456 family protein [Lacipirellulaceae bacterium]